MASSYTAFNTAQPAGSQTGPNFATSANANDLALWYYVVMGQGDGWALSTSGGTAEEPAQLIWSNGVQRVRASITWGTTGGQDGNPTAITWAVSQDSGANYATVGSAATLTYDANGYMTSTTNAGGLAGWLLHLLGWVKKTWTNLSNHAALSTSSGAHGAGTMAAQNANAVAITGGSASVTYEREAKVVKGNVSSSTAIDWAAGGLQTLTVTGAGGTLTHSNLPNGVCGYVTLDVTNGGVATSLLTGCKFAGGAAPSLTASGRDLISLMCHDGSTVNVVGVVKAMA